MSKAETFVVTLAAVIVSFSFVTISQACTCMRMHPQQHYCNSDFVILARVKHSRVLNDTRVYKVRVRKEYKITEKGILALKTGRLNTAAHDSLCGSNLQHGKLYVLSGKIYSLKAYIGLCGMAIPWEELTRRQRKGLKLMYKHGCACQIKNCLGGRCYRTRDYCNWHNHCETKQGICLRQANNSCMWTRTKALTKCTQEWRRNVTISHKNNKVDFPTRYSYNLP